METAVKNDVAQVWKDCLMVIREHVTEQSFKTWFEPIIPYKLINKRLIIQVPSQFFYEWLENNYVKILRKALDYAIGKDGQLEYTIIIDSGGQKAAQKKVETPKEDSRVIPKNPFEIKTSSDIIFDSQLNKNYRFENYVEGSCNRLARAASVAVAQKTKRYCL